MMIITVFYDLLPADSHVRMGQHFELARDY